MTSAAPTVANHSSLAISQGPPPPLILAQLENLAAALQAAAQEPGHKGVTYLDADQPEVFQSYAAVLEEAEHLLGGLRRLGLTPGDRVLFVFERNRDFIPAFWGCQLGGFVPVPLSVPPAYDQPHNALSKLQGAWQMLDGPLVLCREANVAAIKSWAERLGLNGLRAAGVEPLRETAADTAWHPAKAKDEALLLLTSGSTGVPKAVSLSHRNLLARSFGCAQVNGLGPADVSLNWMPLDHVGGIVMYHVQDVCNRCHQIHASTETVLRRPLQWLDWIDQYRVTNTWAPNFAFGLINDQDEADFAGAHWDLSCLRFILNGGEAIVSRTARRFLARLAPFGLPGTAMHPAWGMSETSSGVTFSQRFTLETTSDDDSFVELGEPIPGVAIRIVDVRDQLLREGEIGRLQIRGETVTAGYYKRPEINAEVFTADGWFNTGDLARLSGGSMAITGREKDAIIVNGVNFYSHEIEAVVETVEGVEVSFTAACAIRLAGEDTDQLAVFYHPIAGESSNGVAELNRRISAQVLGKIGLSTDFVVALAREEVPKTAIGKIQRAALKTRLETGGFADRLGKAAVNGRAPRMADDGERLPEWFYRPTWVEAPGRPGAALPRGGCCLLLCEEAGLVETLRKSLGELGQHCVQVVAGSEYARLEADRYQVAPEEKGDYARLLAALEQEEKRTVQAVLHLWTLRPAEPEPESVAALEAAQVRGTYSLLALVQALEQSTTARAAGGVEQPVRLLVGTSFSAGVEPSEPVAYEKAAMLGLVRTIPHELPWLRATHVDLPLAGAEAGATTLSAAECTRWLLAELALQEEGLDVAYRSGGRRLVAQLDKVPLEPAADAVGWQVGGLYVLSGGLGGLGHVIARHLAQQYQARLLVLGRAELAAPRQQALAALEALGGKVLYQTADVTDLTAVRAAMNAAKSKWPDAVPAGVLHLAGVYHEATLAEETRAGLAAVLRPKMAGAWVLDQVARQAGPGCRFVQFSSIISFFGSLSTSAYAAANSFVDRFAEHQRSRGQSSQSLLWSAWIDLGMNRGVDSSQALRARGYMSITAEQGIASLEFALGHTEAAALLIGMDGSNKRLRRFLNLSAADAVNPTPTSTTSTEYVAPRTEIERQIARIWEELLSVPRVGVKDNFFELGGRSLLGARLFGQIQKVLGKNLPISSLFLGPTVEQLAQMIEAQSPPSPCKVLDLGGADSGQRLFLIPCAGNNGSIFRALAQRCGASWHCYALQARGLDDAQPKSDLTISVAETANFFIKEIRTLQPGGPYFLGAHGFGALLAYEVSQQLLAAGETIGSLVLIDPLADDFFPSQYKDAAFNGSSQKFGFGRMLRTLLGSAQSKTKARSARLRRHYGSYELAPYEGSLTLVTSVGTGKPSPEACWQRLAPHDFQLIEVEREQQSLSDAPTLDRLAQLFSARGVPVA